MTKDYYSNCLFEAIKAKFKCGKQVKIIYIPSWKNEVFCPHFMWHDLATDTKRLSCRTWIYREMVQHFLV